MGFDEGCKLLLDDIPIYPGTLGPQNGGDFFFRKKVKKAGGKDKTVHAATHP